MNKAPLITAVLVTGNMKLNITWNTGETFALDFAETIKLCGVFTPLADPVVFEQVVIEEWGHGLDWPGGLGGQTGCIKCAVSRQACSLPPLLTDGSGRTSYH